MTEHNSTWISNGPCDNCGSSDANGLYSDGHTYCQSCGATVQPDGAKTHDPREHIDEESGLITGLKYQELKKSGLSEKTCRMIGYATAVVDVKGFGRVPCHVTSFEKGGRVVAQHLRFQDSDGKKQFRWRGDPSGVELFAMSAWKGRGKKLLIITEGEKDAAAFVECSDGVWATVSVPNGAQNAAKDLKNNLEDILEYDKVVLMFDMDEPGRKAAEECVALFPPGKCGIAELPYKDAHEMLMDGKGDKLKWIPWHTKPWSPDELIEGDDLLDSILNQPENDSLPYPFPLLNEMTHGIRRGEIVMFAAGTGVGKSEIVRQIAYHLRVNHNEKIGYIALEQNAAGSALDLMGYDMDTRLRLTRGNYTDEQLTESFNRVIKDKFVFWNHFGSLESEKLLSRIRYMVQGFDCTTIVLDHISMAVSGNASDNERKDIDILMTSLRSMVEELGFRCLVVSHLKRIKDGAHEEGAQVSLSHLRGSGSIGQVSDIVIGAERNQQGSNPHITQLRVVKDRWTGKVGKADSLSYNEETGKLKPVGGNIPNKVEDNGDPPDF